MKTETFIKTLEKDLHDIIHTAETDFYSLPLEKLNFKSAATTWSALECFEHLNKYAAFYLPEIRNAISSVAPSSTPSSIEYSWLGRYSIDAMAPTNVKKQKTFKRMVPSSGSLDKSVLDQFIRNQKLLLQLLVDMREIDFNQKRVRVEFFRVLKLTIAESLEFVVVHEQRHIQQAHRAIKSGQTAQPVLIL